MSQKNGSNGSNGTSQIRFRAGLVGAGHISEFHVAALRRIPYVEIVGVHDLDRSKAEALGTRFNIPVAESLAALRAMGANVIHVVTPPHTHAAVATEALLAGCHAFVEKPLATDAEACVRLRDLSKERGLEVGVSHSLLFDPQIKSALDKVRAGALGDLISVDILRSSLYPPYAGGSLPPSVPHRRLSVPRPRHPRPVRASRRFWARSRRVDATWRAGQRRRQPGVQRLARGRALQEGHGADPALVRRAAAAAPDHPAGDQGRDAPRPVPDVPGVAQAGAAAQAGRAHRQRADRFDPAAGRRAPQRDRVRAQATAPVPRRAGADHRVLRGAAPGPPPAGDRRGRDQRREVDRGGGARRRRRRYGAGRALPAQRRGALSGDRRVGRPGLGAGRSPARRGAADPGDGAPPARPARGRARRSRVRARRSRRPRGGRPCGARRARGVPRRRGDEGQLARPPGRHHRGDAQRAGVVPQARREQAGARELAVGHRLGGRRAQHAPSTRRRRSRATPRSAARTRRPSSRPRSWSRPRRRAGCRR